MTPREIVILVLLVTICLLVPSLFCLICVACRMHLDAIRRRRLQVFQDTSSLPRDSPVIISLPNSGLDNCTIQSYQKVVLGESLRLPGLNAMTCPICLVEYSAGDSIRLIPLCQHCFHAHCVDEWLKMKATCPVCRNSPPPRQENTKLDQL
ncbi:RING-H2 finger protein ATL20-like [Lycium ferocissimum]|uniref:RING-H2 finger protein ATL20-like n=1 Tax=Lycium ferocissimum TaxID=112874 RepID=UPI0028151DAC|nr:RING-H2 finger protein ATL20-like [Lycium ferocissimum]